MEKAKRIDLRASDLDEQNLKKAAARLGTQKISETIFSSVREVAERVEFFCDREAIRDTNKNVNFGLLHLQTFIDEFKNVTGAILTRDELEYIFRSVTKLGSTDLIQKTIQEVTREKLLDNLRRKYSDMTITNDNLPAVDYSRLFEIAGQVSDIPDVKMKTAGIFWRVYQVDESGKMSIKETEYDELLNGFRYYAETPGELKKLAVVNFLCESLNEILKDPEVVPQAVFSLVYYDTETKRYAPSGAYIKYNHGPKPTFVKYSK